MTFRADVLQIILVVLGANSTVVLVRFWSRHQLNYTIFYDILLWFLKCGFNFTLVLALVIGLVRVVQARNNKWRRIIFAIAVEARHWTNAFRWCKIGLYFSFIVHTFAALQNKAVMLFLFRCNLGFFAHDKPNCWLFDKHNIITLNDWCLKTHACYFCSNALPAI